jgi:G3E family GTPase
MNKQDLYEKEEKKIIEKILERINRNYCILKKTKGHRTETLPIEKMKSIKEKLSGRIHPLVITEFIKFYGELGDHPLSHSNVDKAILLILQLGK